MKKRFGLILLSLCLCLLLSAAAAEGMTARLEGGTLYITWPAGAGESCMLTVYRNGWPVLTLNVNGNAGGATIALGDASGRISARLQTPRGTLACDATGAAAGKPKPAQTAKPTQTKPTATKPASTRAPKGEERPGLAAEVIAQVNAERQKLGLSPLREDDELNRAAAVRAREIARVFSHTRPDGGSWSTVSASAYGENIARGQKTADKVMAAWLTSKSHRDNILKASYGSIGVCAYISGGVTHWVQLFGR